MEKKILKDGIDLIEAHYKGEQISRRDAMKIFGVGGAGMMMASGAVTPLKAADATGKKIVIVGGGLAGIATSALLVKTLSGAEVTVIEPNPKSVSYQPGQTLVGSGVWSAEDISYETKDFVNSDVNLVMDKVVTFNPEQNSVKTAGGKEFKYDYLVVATGLVLDFGAIKGLEAIGDVYSLDPAGAAAAKKVLADSGVCSVYFAEGAVDTWTQMQKFVASAKSGKKVKGLFPEPHTAFKCGGAQKKLVNLTVARLKEAGARENAELSFVTNGKKLFGVPEYHKAIEQQMKDRNVSTRFEHKLVALDLAGKVATFEKHWEVKGAWDADLEEFTMETKKEEVKVPYDFCHLIPPQKAPKEVAESPVGSTEGWVPVNKETLQHVKYPNVFALGDVAAVPLGKTGGSARKQYRVVVENIASMIEGAKALPAKYDGYTVCPLITDIGEVMLAEFKWDPTDDAKSVVAPSFPLDPAQPRWIYWLLKAYALKPMTMYGMLPGRA